MIPEAYIREWYESAPWQEWGMVEQDLLISRMLVELFGNEHIRDKLIFRGGTALHKLFLPEPLRFSEDIDLVQREAGPIGPLFDTIRGIFREWLDEPVRKQGPGVSTLTYRLLSEDTPPLRLRVKIEINTREHFQVLPIIYKTLGVHSRWFEGRADIPVYRIEELMATKLRALYQRRKGRDLFDLAAALRLPDVEPQTVLAAFETYLKAEGHPISASEFRNNVKAKLEHPGFAQDCAPLLLPGTAFDIQADFIMIDKFLISGLEEVKR
jgi:predicted nucleotidyltransferase component of viral defense system